MQQLPALPISHRPTALCRPLILLPLLLLLALGNAAATEPHAGAALDVTLALIEQQANAGNIEQAITSLQQIRRERPTNLNARLMLARYLAWNNQPRAALKVADEALTLAPDNITAKTIKATVSSWRGDYATALPLFEEVLKQDRSFETRLDYHRALANLGNYIWSPTVTTRFNLANSFQVTALEDLRWTRMRKSAPNLRYQQEHYGEESVNIDTLLDYYRALASLGNYRWAADASSQLKPENDTQAQALEDLRWSMMRRSATNLQYQHEYYSDSLENSRTTRSMRLEQPWRNSMFHLALGQSSVADYYDNNFQLYMVEAGLKGTLNNITFASAALGMSKYSDFDTEDVPTARLRLDHTLPDLQLGAEFRREAYDDFTYIVYNQIRTSKSKLELDYHPSDFWNLRLDYLHTKFSDNNNSNELSLTYRYAIHHTPPRVNLGYKIERLGFKTQTFHGYFDPDRATANKALLQINSGGERYEWGIEGFAGQQDISRLGISQENRIAGWQAFFRLHWLKNLYLEITGEGANYGLNKPYQYRYSLFGLRAMMMY